MNTEISNKKQIEILQITKKLLQQKNKEEK